MPEKPKRKNSDEAKPVGCFWGFKYGFVLAIIILGYTYWTIGQSFGEALITVYETEVAGDEARNRISIYNPPQSATDFYWVSSGNALESYGHDLRFQMPANDFNQWLTDSGLCFDALTDDANLLSVSDNLTWWQQDKAETFISGQCGEFKIYTIVVDQTHETNWIIYLSVLEW